LVPTTFFNEEREFGIPQDTVVGDPALGLDVLRAGMRLGVDFASSQELRADHSIYLPYAFLAPSRDVPVLPVFTNCIAPPFPGPERFFRLGQVLRQAVEESPLDRRVVIVTSGHLATEVGGPRQFRGSSDAEFDEDAIRWLGEGRVEEMFRELTLERMLAAGNVTPQFLNFVVAMGVAEGAPAVRASGLRSRFATSPFVEWKAPGE
ncbi:MAG: extradiol ring-cleavage dioxygenase, partial [Pseudonocardia sp.]